MPMGYVKRLAEELGMPQEMAEGIWRKAVKRARDEGQADEHFAYATAVFKAMMMESARAGDEGLKASGAT